MAATPSHSNSETLRRWVQREMGDITEDGAISRFEIWHTQSGEDGERLCKIAVPEEADPEELTKDITDRIAEDAESRMSGMVERYHVRSFKGEEDDHEGYHLVTVRSPSMTRYSGDPSDPPNDKGVIAMLMRYIENREETLIKLIQHTLGALTKDLDTERNLRIQYEKKALEVAQIREKLLDKTAERELAVSAAEGRAQNRQQLLELMKQLAPSVLSNAMGKPAAEGPRETAVKNFLRGLDLREMAGIMNSLSPRKQLILGKILEEAGAGAGNEEESDEDDNDER